MHVMLCHNVGFQTKMIPRIIIHMNDGLNEEDERFYEYISDAETPLSRDAQHIGIYPSF